MEKCKCNGTPSHNSENRNKNKNKINLIQKEQRNKRFICWDEHLINHDKEIFVGFGSECRKNYTA